MSLLGERGPLSRVASTFNFVVGAGGCALLVVASVRSPLALAPNSILLVPTFLALFVFARLMRFEVTLDLNITASLVVPLQIASIVLLGPVVTAWLALPAFLVEVFKERALRGLSGERRRAMLGIVAFNLGMEALMTLAGGACWQGLRPPPGDLGKGPRFYLALMATFLVF